MARFKTVVKTHAATALFSQSFILNPDGTRHSLHVQVQADSSFAKLVKSLNPND